MKYLKLYQELSLCEIEEVERLFNQLMEIFEELDDSFLNLNVVIKQRKFLYDYTIKVIEYFMDCLLRINYVRCDTFESGPCQQKKSSKLLF